MTNIIWGDYMKITIENMGPVEYFELDLDKPLTVIYGGNNIGKSYAMQVCYLLMKSFYVIDVRHFAISGINPRFITFHDDIIDQAAGEIIEAFYSSKYKMNHEVDITDDIQPQIINATFSRSAERFFEACESTFRVIKNNCNEPRVCMKLNGFSLTLNIEDKTIKSDYSIKTVSLQQRSNVDSHAKYDTKKKHKIFIRDKKDKEIELICYQSHDEMRKLISLFFKNQKNSFYLPASRSGIYAGLSSVGAVVAQVTQNRKFITQGLTIPSISEPVADYYLALMEYNGTFKERLRLYAKEIEEDILAGEVTFDSNRSEYQFSSGEIEFDLMQTSSMVAEVSIIVAYLKFIVPDNNNVVLFIEEPEAHLHPENQVRLTEILASMAKNIKLVISSHSNYIFNKLNNMALDGKIDGQIYNPIIMDPVMTGGKGRSLEVTSLGVNDENFTDVTEELWREREEIIERRNSEESEGD